MRKRFSLIFSLVVGMVLVACTSTPVAAPAETPTETPTELAADDAGAIPAFVAPTPGTLDEAAVASIDVAGVPLLPEPRPWWRALYAAGLDAGHNPQVFSTMGDCMTETDAFLVPFSQGDYDLGPYTELQGVVDHFAGVSTRGGDWALDSFGDHGLAAAGGFNVGGPLDATWADPNWCNPGETPLACEYRVTQASFAVVMFGTNDVQYVDPALYDFSLRMMVYQSLMNNTLPILSTFPTHPVDPARSELLNQIVVQVARDYDIPLVNLNRALGELENNGVPPDDPLTLSKPPSGAVAVFTEANLQYGATMRNLLTLQALDIVWRYVMDG